MADPREDWPSLSPRERDARVAEALGVKPRIEWFVRLRENPDCISFTAKTEEECSRFYSARGHAYRADYEMAPVELHEPYSERWYAAGPLLDALGAEGWAVNLGLSATCNPKGWGFVLYQPHPPGTPIETLSEYGLASGPEAISLAFVLAAKAKGGGA